MNEPATVSVVFGSLKDIWDSKPMIIIMLVIGFAVFLFVVMDARRHKRKRKGPRY